MSGQVSRNSGASRTAHGEVKSIRDSRSEANQVIAVEIVFAQLYRRGAATVSRST
jgi:hypothetical protein